MYKENKICLVESNTNCIGCNKCIRNCASTHGLKAYKDEKGKSKIKVDTNKCISCGTCYTICEHDAIDYNDDTDLFFKALKSGKKISLLIAPSFFANYSDNFGEILGGLKELGANKIINVGFGADISTWGYINHIKNNKMTGAISQPCPTVVSYIENYEPSLIPNIVPIQSPMMCSAIYAKNVMKIEDEIAFIGPCISKKEEQISKRGKGIIKYNVTFKKLMEYVKANNIYGENIENEIEYGIGTIYPITGGLSETIQWFLGEDELIRHLDGSNNTFNFFSEKKEFLKSPDNPYFLIDALNCENGCCFGPAADKLDDNDEKPLFEIMKIRKKVKTSDDILWTHDLPHQNRLELLNQKFSHIDIKDYMCEYDDFSERTKLVMPTETELKYIYHTMNKRTTEDIEIQCGCCGYDTCAEMAIAIHNKMNIKENCVYYMKDEVAKEKDRARKAEIFVELSKKDLHTGLSNRNAYYSLLNAQKDYTNCGIVVFDLNDLKKCNDTYGHEVGDNYIKTAATIIGFVFNNEGKTFRIGGDEFCAVVEDATIEILEESIYKVKMLVHEQNELNELPITMRIACGSAVFSPEMDNNFEDTIKRADMVMYNDKEISKKALN